MTTPTVPTATLNNCVEMPLLGFGVYQVDPDETERVVADALEVGYRHVDTAAGYGNEQGVGAAIAGSGLTRDDVFVTTKLWVQDKPAEANTRTAFEKSLERLGLDHVDLYLIHQPFGDLHGQWRAMEQIHAEGLARAIGVSNFHQDRLLDLIIHNEVAPAVNQVELHPFLQRADDQAFMAEHGVLTEAWGGFAEGRGDLFSNPVLSEVGSAYDKSVAQVVTRWLLQRGIATIPKSVRRERMAENFDVLDFELSDDDMARIATLDTGRTMFFDHREPEWVQRLGSVRVD